MPGICEPSVGLAADDLDLRVLLLEEARAAHDGAGGAHAGDEVRDPALGVAPDLRARCPRSATSGLSGLANWSSMMPLPSRAIFSARSRAASMPPSLRREHDLGAEGAHGLAPLDRQVLGHDQDHAVAAHRRRHGERDAGVAAGRLDQRVAGLDRRRAPRRARIIDSAGRSFTEPAGLLPSSLARIDVAVRRPRRAGASAAPAACCRRSLRWSCRSSSRSRFSSCSTYVARRPAPRSGTAPS